MKVPRPPQCRSSIVTTMKAQPTAAVDGERHRVLIIGGGTGGVGVAAQLRGKGVSDICIVEPAETHYYQVCGWGDNLVLHTTHSLKHTPHPDTQPGWTFVGSGIFEAGDTARPMAEVIPDGVRWVRDAATEFRPETNQVVLKSGAVFSYDYLVVAMGLQCDWGLIRGLPEALARGDGVCSNYGESSRGCPMLSVNSRGSPMPTTHTHKYYMTDPKHAAATWQAVQRLGVEGGNAIFTQPDTPVKCGGAPQKIMWLTEDYLRREGKRVRELSACMFACVCIPINLT